MPVLRFLSLVVLALAFISPPANALQKPRAIATDHRIQTVRYSENEVYSFIGHYGYQSIIQFAPDEEIVTVSLGDSVAWQVSPVGSRLFLKPVEQDALTNMSVITNKRVYQFELHAEETENIDDAKMLFVLRFLYPDDATNDFTNYYPEEGVPDLSDPEVRATLNFGYSIVGPDTISPIRIFDDGEFTYFQFKDKNASIPAFFQVKSSGEEAVINFRKSGDYIVVEQVASRFTLRKGPDVLCVFNESMPPTPAVQPVEQHKWYDPI